MKEIGLDNIADGVAQELFRHELAKISDNIADANTQASLKRTITLSFADGGDPFEGKVVVL